MEFPRRTFLRLAAGAAALPTASRIAKAQAYPSRPVTMVIPFPAGGGQDLVGRALVARLSEVLGHNVIAENVIGKSGMVGTTRVAKAVPDGYEFVLGTTGTHVMNQSIYKSPLYDAATDFAPVVSIGDTPFVLLTRKGLPITNLHEFIAYTKANQATMRYVAGGKGSMTQLACEIFNATIGVNVAQATGPAGTPVFPDYECRVGITGVGQSDNNAMNAMAIFTRDRSPNMPNLASAHEQGLTDFEVSGLFAFFLPKGTPTPIITALHDATVATLETPVVAAKLKELGIMIAPPERRSPEYLQTRISREIASFSGIIKAAGISLD
jgi:tripartite-type tricarboxylate transporter receptor subunit TctC